MSQQFVGQASGESGPSSPYSRDSNLAFRVKGTEKESPTHEIAHAQTGGAKASMQHTQESGDYSSMRSAGRDYSYPYSLHSVTPHYTPALTKQTTQIRPSPLSSAVVATQPPSETEEEIIDSTLHPQLLRSKDAPEKDVQVWMDDTATCIVTGKAAESLSPLKIGRPLEKQGSTRASFREAYPEEQRPTRAVQTRHENLGQRDEEESVRDMEMHRDYETEPTSKDTGRVALTRLMYPKRRERTPVVEGASPVGSLFGTRLVRASRALQPENATEEKEVEVPLLKEEKVHKTEGMAEKMIDNLEGVLGQVAKAGEEGILAEPSGHSAATGGGTELVDMETLQEIVHPYSIVDELPTYWSLGRGRSSVKKGEIIPVAMEQAMTRKSTSLPASVSPSASQSYTIAEQKLDRISPTHTKSYVPHKLRRSSSERPLLRTGRQYSVTDPVITCVGPKEAKGQTRPFFPNPYQPSPPALHRASHLYSTRSVDIGPGTRHFVSAYEPRMHVSASHHHAHSDPFPYAALRTSKQKKATSRLCHPSLHPFVSPRSESSLRSKRYASVVDDGEADDVGSPILETPFVLSPPPERDLKDSTGLARPSFKIRQKPNTLKAMLRKNITDPLRRFLYSLYGLWIGFLHVLPVSPQKLATIFEKVWLWLFQLSVLIVITVYRWLRSVKTEVKSWKWSKESVGRASKFRSPVKLAGSTAQVTSGGGLKELAGIRDLSMVPEEVSRDTPVISGRERPAYNYLQAENVSTIEYTQNPSESTEEVGLSPIRGDPDLLPLELLAEIFDSKKKVKTTPKPPETTMDQKLRHPSTPSGSPTIVPMLDSVLAPLLYFARATYPDPHLNHPSITERFLSSLLLDRKSSLLRPRLSIPHSPDQGDRTILGHTKIVQPLPLSSVPSSETEAAGDTGASTPAAWSIPSVGRVTRWLGGALGDLLYKKVLAPEEEDRRKKEAARQKPLAHTQGTWQCHACEVFSKQVRERLEENNDDVGAVGPAGSEISRFTPLRSKPMEAQAPLQSIGEPTAPSVYLSDTRTPLLSAAVSDPGFHSAVASPVSSPGRFPSSRKAAVIPPVESIATAAPELLQSRAFLKLSPVTRARVASQAGVTSPDLATVECPHFVNAFLSAMWPQLCSYIEGHVAQAVNKSLQEEPLPLPLRLLGISVSLQQLLIGATPPTILSVRGTKAGPLAYYLDFDIEFKNYTQIKFHLKQFPLQLFTAPIPINVSGIEIMTSMRVQVEPLLNAPPFVGGIHVALLQPPVLDGKLSVMGIDVLGIPLISPAFFRLMTTVFSKALMYPRGITIDFNSPKPKNKGMHRGKPRKRAQKKRRQ